MQQLGLTPEPRYGIYLDSDNLFGTLVPRAIRFRIVESATKRCYGDLLHIVVTMVKMVRTMPRVGEYVF